MSIYIDGDKGVHDCNKDFHITRDSIYSTAIKIYCASTMITYEQDLDVIRWGLQLFDGDPYSNCGYCGSISQHSADCYPGHYLKGYQYDSHCNYAGEPNLNVNSLHEELSQLSVNEPIKSFQSGMEHRSSTKLHFVHRTGFRIRWGTTAMLLMDMRVNMEKKLILEFMLRVLAQGMN